VNGSLEAAEFWERPDLIS